MAAPVFANFTKFLSVYLPEGAYRYSPYAIEGEGDLHNKSQILDIAERLFKTNETLRTLNPDEIGPVFIHHFYDASDKDKQGKLHIHGIPKNFIKNKKKHTVVPEKIDVEFDGKHLNCRFISKLNPALPNDGTDKDPGSPFEATCSATDNGRIVFDGGQSLGKFIPYTFVAGSAYFGAKAIKEIGRLYRDVILPNIEEEEEEQQPAKFYGTRVMNIALLAFRHREQIKLGENETLGMVCRRIGVNLAKGGALLAAACGGYLYHSQYTRI